MPSLNDHCAMFQDADAPHHPSGDIDPSAYDLSNIEEQLASLALHAHCHAHESALKSVRVVRSDQARMEHVGHNGLTLYVPVRGAVVICDEFDTVRCAGGHAILLTPHCSPGGVLLDPEQSASFLGLTLDIEITRLRSVIDRLDVATLPAPGEPGGHSVLAVTPALSECLARLIRLLAAPRGAPLLMPSIIDEIVYCLLQGPGTNLLLHLAALRGKIQRVADAIRILNQSPEATISISDLAGFSRMSVSSFYQYFKTLTTTTPIQYQKKLRLQTARHLLENGERNVATAAYQVGYRSSSQFSREYRRLFGISPKESLSFRAE